MKPTIEELERILAGGAPANIEILPNGEIRAVPCHLSFGTGALYVMTGTYEGLPAVFVAKASKPGPIGTSSPEEDGDLHALKPGEYVMTFPSEAQATRFADAICPDEEMVWSAWTNLCEKGDRSSPENYPDMCLITKDELAEYMRGARAGLCK